MKFVAVLKGIACINHIIVEFLPNLDKKRAIIPLFIKALTEIIKSGTLTISVEIPFIPKHLIVNETIAKKHQM